MKDSILKLGKWLLILLGIMAFLFFSFLLFIHFSDYKPAKKEQLFIKNLSQQKAENQSTYSLLSWNLGYCGLGKEMDFFHEGGEQVRPSKAQVQKYLSQNLAFIKSQDSIDFFFFQEVDKSSKRSYYFDQSEKLKNLLASYNSVFADNYRVPFVPIPLLNPMGSVEAGVMTFSRYFQSEAIRYAYPNLATWPENLFLLDRCFVLSRHPLPSGKELVLINTHNSYYVSEDSLRIIELNILKTKMLQEYEKGNFVIAGGDWNKYPPHFFEKTQLPSDILQNNVHCLDTDFLPSDWSYAFDPHTPSNRELAALYKKGETKLAVIDFFVVSPNIKIENCKTFPLGFENSDHNPVQLNFSFIHE